MKKLVLLGWLFAAALAHADFNARTDVLNLPLGYLNAEVDFPVAEAWTLGPQVAFLNENIFGYHTSTTSIGIVGMYYFSGKVFSGGWYVAPEISYSSLKIGKSDPTYSYLTASTDLISIAAKGGYRWQWDNWNLTVGFGLNYSDKSNLDLKSSDGITRDTYSGTFAHLGFISDTSVGWKF